MMKKSGGGGGSSGGIWAGLAVFLAAAALILSGSLAAWNTAHSDSRDAGQDNALSAYRANVTTTFGWIRDDIGAVRQQLNATEAGLQAQLVNITIFQTMLTEIIAANNMTTVQELMTLFMKTATLMMDIAALQLQASMAQGQIATIEATLASVASVLPGTIFAWGGFTAPPGYLLCEGDAVSKTVYADLFTQIGCMNGGGCPNGTHFYLPDMRGRVPVGQNGAPGSVFNFLAATPGQELHTLTTAEMPSHTHTVQSGGTHTHAVGVPSTSFDGRITVGFSSDAFSMNNTISGSGGPCLVTSSNSTPPVRRGIFTTGYSTLDNTEFCEQVRVGAGAFETHTHDIVSAGSHTHTADAAGSGEAHNNVQPSFVVKYIIKI